MAKNIQLNKLAELDWLKRFTINISVRLENVLCYCRYLLFGLLSRSTLSISLSVVIPIPPLYFVSAFLTSGYVEQYFGGTYVYSLFCKDFPPSLATVGLVSLLFSCSNSSSLLKALKGADLHLNPYFSKVKQSIKLTVDDKLNKSTQTPLLVTISDIYTTMCLY